MYTEVPRVPVDRDAALGRVEKFLVRPQPRLESPTR
jgi:hypothetical protein